MQTDFKPYEGGNPYIFVSYSHKDSDRVIPILNEMNRAGFRVWYDEGINGGETWRKVIASHIADCSVFLLFLSRAYIESGNCSEEIHYARHEDKQIVPVRLESVKPPRDMELILTRLHYLSLERFLIRLNEEDAFRSCRDVVPFSPQSVMPSENYVVFLGGTGAKVLSAFLHLCAAGAVRLKKPVHMILLDMDEDNGACIEAGKIYENYVENYKKFHTPEVKRVPGTVSFPAFGVELDLNPIITLVRPQFSTLELAAAGYNEDRKLSWFYTEEERSLAILNGSCGRSNIDCLWFQNLGSQLTCYTEQIRGSLMKREDVRIVVVGSVFGGTGAAGIPGVLNFIQDVCHESSFLTDAEIKRHLHIGGVLVTPYFRVAEPLDFSRVRCPAKSDTFFKRAKSVLNYMSVYYNDRFERIYLTGQNGLQLVNPSYCDGGPDQKNKSHVVELIAALGIKNYLMETGDAKTSPQIFTQILDWEAREPVFSWNSLDPDFSAVADMVRTQALLKGVFGPYVERPHGFYKPRWYKAFRMDLPEREEELQSLMRYTDIFLDWIYNIQYELPDGGYGRMKRDDRIALAGPIFEELMSGDMREDYLYAHFDELLEIRSNLQHISYHYTDARQLVNSVGAADEALAALGSAGLFIQLFNQARRKK